MNEQNWVKGQAFQDYFGVVVLITENRNETKDNIIELQLSFYDCNTMNYSNEYRFTQSALISQLTFQTFKDLMKKIDELLYSSLIAFQKSFIFCTFGKDLFLKLIPELSIYHDFKPQSYFLQFIDLRTELYTFMTNNYPEVQNELEGSMNNLLPLMISKLHLPKLNESSFSQIHYQLKEIIQILHNENHRFSIPVIINPQNIYGLKYYLRDPWFNSVPEGKQKQSFYIKVRGIPFQSTKQDLIQFFDIEALNKQNIVMKYTSNGTFNGEAYICVSTLDQLEELKSFHKAQMDHRYIEILGSTFDEFQDAKSTSVNLIQASFSNSGQGKKEIVTEDNDYKVKHSGILKLRGLPWSCSEKDVRDFLQNSSKIKSVKLLFDNNGKAKGQCFVVAKDLEAAEKLKQQFHNKTIGKRYIEVFISTSREYLNEQRSRSRSLSKD